MPPRSPRDRYALVWSLYYPDENYHLQDPRLDLVDLFHGFLTSAPAHLQAVVQPSWDCCYIDAQNFANMLPFDDFECVLVSRPVELTTSLAIALSTVYGAANPYQDPKPITPRFYNLSQLIPYGEVNASSVGQLVSIEGHVSRVAPAKPLIHQASFLCAKCSQQTSVRFEDGIFEPPRVCSTVKCYNKYLELDRRAVQLTDFQRLRLTEVDQATDRIPRVLDVELRDVLVNTCIAGDIVRVTGIVRTIQQETFRPKYNGNKMAKESGIHQLYILATSIVCLKSSGDRAAAWPAGGGHLLDSSLQTTSCASCAPAGPAVDFNESELESIREIALSDKALPMLVNSLCPSIFGHELVKAGLLLALFGGSPSDSSVSVRTSIHLLIVGDPGLGKSQLLRAAAAIAPRAVLVSGQSSSAAGLTVAITRDPGGEVCIEAGALILADQGCCFIDELDKLSCDSHALLEAMEQQSISIAKAGVVTSLRSRTAVIAAANPVSGHYNRRKSVCENLKMNAALLSRFDLIFILVDRPDEGQDELISDHIFGTSSSSSRKRPVDAMRSDEQLTFLQKLRRQVSAVHSDQQLSTEQMRRYIDYARRYVHPKLSRPAAKVLQKHYLEMRAARGGKDALPVTTRHLESLIRLAQARARVDLREEVTENDATDVVALLQECLLDGITDELGRIDSSRRGGLSLAKQMKALVAVLQKEAKQRGNAIFHRSEMQELAGRLGLDKDLDSLIESMRTECYLLLKGPKQYQLQTV